MAITIVKSNLTNIPYTAKEAFKGATVADCCIFPLECQYFSVWFHLELLSPASSHELQQVMDEEPLSQQYLEKGLCLYYKQLRFHWFYVLCC